MNFCSSCGESVIKKIPEGDNRERHVCESLPDYSLRKPTGYRRGTARSSDQILLCRRAIEPRHGFWTLPAGFLENGESSLQGALRECEEEANAQVVDPDLYALFDIPQINQVYVFYRAKWPKPKFNPTFRVIRSGAV